MSRWRSLGFAICLVGCGGQPGVMKISIGLSDVSPAALGSVVLLFTTGDATALTGSLGQIDTTQDGVRVVAAWRNGSLGVELAVQAFPFKTSAGASTMDLHLQLAPNERSRTRAVTLRIAGFDASNTQITTTETVATQFDSASKVDVGVTLRCATAGTCGQTASASSHGDARYPQKQQPGTNVYSRRLCCREYSNGTGKKYVTVTARAPRIPTNGRKA